MPEPLLSPDMSAAPEAAGHPSRHGLREARHVDAPVQSPVHALQHEIQRAHEAVAESDSREGKSPGWVRLGFPVVASMLLWTVIIGFIRMLG